MFIICKPNATWNIDWLFLSWMNWKANKCKYINLTWCMFPVQIASMVKLQLIEHCHISLSLTAFVHLKLSTKHIPIILQRVSLYLHNNSLMSFTNLLLKNLVPWIRNNYLCCYFDMPSIFIIQLLFYVSPI